MTQSHDKFFIPSSYSRIVARELALQERDLAQLLGGTGLSQEILLPGDETQLTGQQQLRILENAWRMSGAADLGLRLGHRLQPSTHGPLGYLTLSSPNLITALRSLADFLPTRIPFAQLDISFDGDWLCCAMSLKLESQQQNRRLLLECFALILQSVIEAVLGRELTEARFAFDYDRPDYHDSYRRYLHSPMAFCEPASTLVIPAALAKISNASGDPETFALAQNMCLKLLDQVPSLALSTRDRVRRLLLSQPTISVTEDDIARAMFICKRTLARRLTQEGTSYRRVRDELLSDLAARHLCESDLTVEAIGALLGYHDTANFRRAFRRWFDMPPNTFRRVNTGS